ncbi:MAG: ArnT family glycosyltransferase [Myxococcota bacterium]
MPPRRGLAAGELALLLGMFALLALLHGLQLDADPPGAVQRHFLTDEGWWSHDARLHYLFGKWSMDDHNVALLWAPLFTGTLRLVFEVGGEGLVQLRLLSAVSGLLTCLLVFGFVRSWHGRRAAFAATLLFGTHFFTLTHHRIGYPETFQGLFVAGTFLAVVAAASRPAWGLVAGVSFACALLAKISALWVAAPLAVFWGFHFRRRDDAAWPPFRWSAVGAFAAGAAAVGAVVALVLVWPHLEWLEVGLARRISVAGSENPIRGLAQLGLHHGFPVGEIRASGFFRQSPLLLFALGIGLLGGGVGSDRRKGSPLTVMCGCWLAVGFLAVGAELAAPDRRFLGLTPALCILVAIALVERRIAVPGRAPRSRIYDRRALAVGLAAGVLLGLVLRGGLAEWMRATLELSQAVSSLLAWVVFACGAVVSLPPLLRWLPVRPVVVPAAAFVPVFLTLHLGWFGSALVDPHYTVRDGAERVALLTQDWPAGERAILGDAADTLALGSGQFAFLIRRWEHRGVFMNLDGWERFDPWLVLGEAPDRPGFESLPPLELAPGPDGAPRFTIPVHVRRQTGRMPLQ